MYENEIKLRRLTNDDYEQYMAIASQGGKEDILSAKDIIGFPIESREDFETALWHYEEDGNGMFAVAKTGSGDMVGVLSQKQRNDEASIGVFIGSPFRNFQYATTAIEDALGALDEKRIKTVSFEVPQKDKRAVYLAEHFTDKKAVENGNLVVYNVPLQKHKDEYIPRMVGLEIELDLCNRLSAMADMEKTPQRDEMIKDEIVGFCADHPGVSNKAIVSKVIKVLGDRRRDLGITSPDEEQEK